MTRNRADTRVPDPIFRFEVAQARRRVRGPRGLRVLRGFELGQDAVIVVAVAILYLLMARQLLAMWRHVQVGLELRAILTDILFLLILVEVFRLLMHYLVERRVAVGTMVEIGIISVLREVILMGPLEIPWPQLLTISVLLLTLGGLLRFADLRRGGPHRGRASRRVVPAPREEGRPAPTPGAIGAGDTSARQAPGR